MKDDNFTFLRQVPLFSELGEADLLKICQSVEKIQLDSGTLLFEEGDEAKHAFVIVEGKIEIFKTTGGKKLQLAVRKQGEVIGEMSLLEASTRVASAMALTHCQMLAISHGLLERLLFDNPSAARTMLRTVFTRLHSTEASLRQSEKMAQLGSFTAGIAHEVNNPSAAVLRGSEQLKMMFERCMADSFKLRTSLISTGQLEDFIPLRHEVHERANRPPEWDTATRLDREAELENWLQNEGFEDGWELAPQLAELGYDEATLKALVHKYSASIRPVLLNWIIAEAEIQRLLDEIHQGADQIAKIVKALKSYVYLDQAPNQEIDIHEGLENTLVILRHKLKQGVEVIREFDHTLPAISAYGSELNQVWTNIIDNSIDAMDGKGRIVLRTGLRDGWVVVEIEDNGPGIPPEVQERLFYPFFTTKPVGQGTGMGLNISYRIVQKHGGEIRVTSQPGQTRFVIRLPVAGQGHPDQNQG